jgi:hypothetical protein
MQKNKDLFTAHNWPGQKNQIFSLNKNTQNKNLTNRRVCYFCQKGFTQSEYDIHLTNCEEKLKLAQPEKIAEEKIQEQNEKEENKFSNKKSDEINKTLNIELNDNKNFIDEEDNSNNFQISKILS